MNRSTRILGIILIVFVAMAFLGFGISFVYDKTGSHQMSDELLLFLIAFGISLACIPLSLAFIISLIIHKVKNNKMKSLNGKKAK